MSVRATEWVSSTVSAMSGASPAARPPSAGTMALSPSLVLATPPPFLPFWTLPFALPPDVSHGATYLPVYSRRRVTIMIAATAIAVLSMSCS